MENFSWGPGKSWKSPGFFVSKRVGTLIIRQMKEKHDFFYQKTASLTTKPKKTTSNKNVCGDYIL